MKKLSIRVISIFLSALFLLSAAPLAALASEIAPQVADSTSTSASVAPPPTHPTTGTTFTGRSGEQMISMMEFAFRATRESIREANNMPASQTQISIGQTINIPAPNMPNLQTWNMTPGSFYIRSTYNNRYLTFGANDISTSPTAGATRQWNIAFPWNNFEVASLSPTTGTPRFLHGVWGAAFNLSLNTVNYPPHLRAGWAILPEVDGPTNTRFRIVNVVAAQGLITDADGNLATISTLNTEIADLPDSIWWTFHYTTPPVVTGVSITPNTTMNFVPGNTRQLTATSLPAPVRQDITRRVPLTTTWSSGNADVATVSPTGLVTAVGRGSTTITATIGGQSSSVTINVTQPATGITASPTNVTLNIIEGQAMPWQDIVASVLPTNANNQTIIWSSSNANIAQVDSNGRITAVNTGSAIITARSQENAAHSIDIFVTVGRPAQSISLPDNWNLYLGHVTNYTHNLQATFTPTNPSNAGNVVWSVYPLGIVSVSQNGTITALAPGSAVVTAQLGSLTATTTVNVTSLVAQIGVCRNNVTLLANDPSRRTTQIIASMLPSNPCNPTLFWESLHPSIATVDGNGNITAHAYGTATIRVFSEDGNAETIITVTVRTIADGIHVPHRNIRLYILGPNTPPIGRIQAEVLPTNAVNRELTWSSSDTSIVTVYQNGNIRPVSEGVATITILNEYSGVYETVTVTVTQLDSGILLDRGQVTLYIRGSNMGGVDTLVPIVYPPAIANPDLVWASENTNIVYVDQYGRITAIGAGVANISVTLDGESATALVTVIVLVTEIELCRDRETLFIQGNNNGTFTPNVTLRPNSPCNTALSWSSSNTSVATVDSNGVIRAVGVGTATIRVVALGSATHDGRYGEPIYTEITITVTNLPTGIRIVNPPSTLIINGSNRQSALLSAIISPNDVCDPLINWSSSNINIATVDSNGRVTAVAPGTVRITAEIGGFEAFFYLEVRSLVTQITPNTRNVTINLGRGSSPFFQLAGTVSPNNATNQNLNWRSSNTAIVTVDANGRITAHSRGTATITITSVDGNSTTTVNVTVVQLVTSVTVSPDRHTLNTGQTLPLIAEILPMNANNRNFRWEVIGNYVSINHSTGVITALRPGNATIRAISTCGNLMSYAIISVIQPPTSVQITPTWVHIYPGESRQLTFAVFPLNAFDTTVTWTSSNNNVFHVAQNGRVTAVGSPGQTATITATSANGLTASITVRINIPVTSVVVSGANQITVGGSSRFSADVLPTNATNRAVRWESSNTSIATVDQNGNVSGRNAGTVTIRAISVSGAVVGERSVRIVLPAPSGVTISPGGNFTLSHDGSEQLTANVLPSNASPRNVTWESSNTNVATVTQNGLVRAVGAGTATITVRTSNGRTAEVRVTVERQVIPQPELPRLQAPSSPSQPVTTPISIPNNNNTTVSRTLEIIDTRTDSTIRAGQIVAIPQNSRTQLRIADRTLTHQQWEITNNRGNSTVNDSGRITTSDRFLAANRGRMTIRVSARNANGQQLTTYVELYVVRESVFNFFSSIEIFDYGRYDLSSGTFGRPNNLIREISRPSGSTSGGIYFVYILHSTDQHVTRGNFTLNVRGVANFCNVSVNTLQIYHSASNTTVSRGGFYEQRTNFEATLVSTSVFRSDGRGTNWNTRANGLNRISNLRNINMAIGTDPRSDGRGVNASAQGRYTTNRNRNAEIFVDAVFFGVGFIPIAGPGLSALYTIGSWVVGDILDERDHERSLRVGAPQGRNRSVRVSSYDDNALQRNNDFQRLRVDFITAHRWDMHTLSYVLQFDSNFNRGGLYQRTARGFERMSSRYTVSRLNSITINQRPAEAHSVPYIRPPVEGRIR